MQVLGEVGAQLLLHLAESHGLDTVVEDPEATHAELHPDGAVAGKAHELAHTHPALRGCSRVRPL